MLHDDKASERDRYLSLRVKLLGGGGEMAYSPSPNLFVQIMHELLQTNFLFPRK